MRERIRSAVTMFLGIAGFFGVATTSYLFGSSGTEQRIEEALDAEKSASKNLIENVRAQSNQQMTVIKLELENLRASFVESKRGQENSRTVELQKLRSAHNQEVKKIEIAHASQLSQTRISATEIAEARAARAQTSQENQMRQFASLAAVFRRLSDTNQVPAEYQSIVKTAVLTIPKQLVDRADKALPPGVIKEKTYACLKNCEAVWLLPNSSVDSCQDNKTMMFVKFTSTTAISVSVDGVEYYTYPGQQRNFEKANCSVQYLGTRKIKGKLEAKLKLKCK